MRYFFNNALYRAFSISTKIRQLKVKFHDVCQCPLSGFLHFYLAKAGKYLDILVKCQCPLSGFLHFYGIAEGDEFKIICVNALYRAFSISTYYCALRHEEHSNCVNALYRAFSISTAAQAYPGKVVGMCQCPLSGFLHFYAPLWERPKMKHLRTRFCR